MPFEQRDVRDHLRGGAVLVIMDGEFAFRRAAHLPVIVRRRIEIARMQLFQQVEVVHIDFRPLILRIAVQEMRDGFRCHPAMANRRGQKMRTERVAAGKCFGMPLTA